MRNRTMAFAVPDWGLVCMVVALLCVPARAAEEPSALRTGDDAILAALDEAVELEMIEIPLGDLVDFIKHEKRIEVQLDLRALDDVGIAADAPVTKSVAGVSLRSALELILRDLDLTWTIANEVLLITTPEEAEMTLLARVYDVGDLTTCRTPEGELWQDFDGLIHTVTSTIAPESWAEVGGPGSLAPLEYRGAKVLVVRQTVVVHQEIAQLFDDMRKVAEKYGDEEYPVRKPPAPAARSQPAAYGAGGGMGGGPEKSPREGGFH